MRTSFALRIALGLLPLAATLTGCAPGGDAGDGTTTVTGEVRPGGTLDPSKNQLGHIELAAGAPSLPYSFDCTGRSSCAIAVGVRFEAQTLLNADLSGLDGILDLVIIDSVKAKTYAKVALGMQGGNVTSTYVSSQLPPANYAVMINLRSNLPQPDFSLVPIDYCIGGQNAASCDGVASSSSPSTRVTLSGRLVTQTVTDIMTGTVNTDGVPDQAIELVRKNGSSIAGRFAMKTDAAGYWSASSVLPDTYALKVNGTLYPISVNAHDVEQQAQDISL